MPSPSWISWHYGVDLDAMTDPGLPGPNLIIHAVQMAHTPPGDAAHAVVLFQPDPAAPPVVMGFVTENPAVGDYFRSRLFVGTPFETAPVLAGTVEILAEYPERVGSRVTVGDLVLETSFTGLSELSVVNWPVAPGRPFSQQLCQAGGQRAELRANGREVPVHLLPVGLSGGPAALWTVAGITVR